MKYTDLTIHQRISLKGLFQTNEELKNYLLVWIVWGFVKAVEYFLNDDLEELYIDI